jgi:hypothetical protein
MSYLRTHLQTTHDISYKQDMSPPTIKAWALLQTRLEPSYKQDMSSPTNKTWSLPQTRHDLSHIQDMISPTNKTWSHVLFVGEIMSCLWERSCLVCGRDHVLFTYSPPHVVLCFCFVFLCFLCCQVSLDCPFFRNSTANKTCTQPKTRNELSHKQDMIPPTNKTWSLPQTRHDLSHKQDMISPTYKTWSLPQTRHDLSHPTVVLFSLIEITWNLNEYFIIVSLKTEIHLHQLLNDFENYGTVSEDSILCF